MQPLSRPQWPPLLTQNGLNHVPCPKQQAAGCNLWVTKSPVLSLLATAGLHERGQGFSGKFISLFFPPIFSELPICFRGFPQMSSKGRPARPGQARNHFPALRRKVNAGSSHQMGLGKGGIAKLVGIHGREVSRLLNCAIALGFFEKPSGSI